MTIRVHNSQQELVESVAAEISLLIRDCEKESFNLVVTGGGLGIATIGALGRQDFERKKLRVMFCDERFVNPSHPDRNEHQAMEAWPEIADCQFIKYPETDGSVISAAKEFSASLEHKFAPLSDKDILFDLVLLGMGEDGHIASLFPNRQHSKSLVVAEAQSPKPPKERLSLSYEALNRAKRVWFVVGGKAKTEALKQVIEGSELPASKVKGSAETLWWIDKELSDGL